MINLGAAVQQYSTSATFIIRNSDGTLLLAQGIYLHPYSVLYVELPLAWAELKVAATLFRDKELVV